MKYLCYSIIVIILIVPCRIHASDNDKSLSNQIVGVIGLNAFGWWGNGSALAKRERSMPPAIYSIVVGGITVFLGNMYGTEWTTGPRSSEILMTCGGISLVLAVLNLMQENPNNFRIGNNMELVPMINLDHGDIRQVGLIFNMEF